MADDNVIRSGQRRISEVEITATHICECSDCDAGRMEDRCIFAELLEGIFHVYHSEGAFEDVVEAVADAQRKINQQQELNHPVPEEER